MEIKIKSMGYNIGTIGWLKKELENGKTVFEEGTCKNGGNHGLWITTSKGSELIALFDQFDNKGYGYPEKYELVSDEAFAVHSIPFTPAARKIINEIAQNWCDLMNNARENDNGNLNFKIIIG